MLAAAQSALQWQCFSKASQTAMARSRCGRLLTMGALRILLGGLRVLATRVPLLLRVLAPMLLRVLAFMLLWVLAFMLLWVAVGWYASGRLLLGCLAHVTHGHLTRLPEHLARYVGCEVLHGAAGETCIPAVGRSLASGRAGDRTPCSTG